MSEESNSAPQFIISKDQLLQKKLRPQQAQLPIQKPQQHLNESHEPEKSKNSILTNSQENNNNNNNNANLFLMKKKMFNQPNQKTLPHDFTSRPCRTSFASVDLAQHGAVQSRETGSYRNSLRSSKMLKSTLYGFLAETEIRKTTLLIGNPGTGKSTLSNALIGFPCFQSGISFGEGLTKLLQIHERLKPKNYFIGDTPGLADGVLQGEASQAIYEALTSGGSFQLMFVINLKSGRVRQDDAHTIRLVLETLPENFPYGIVINKVSPREYTELQKEDNKKKLYSSLFIGFRATPFILMIKEDKNIADLDNEQLKGVLLREFFDFVYVRMPYELLNPDSVKSIDLSNYKELCEQMEQTRLQILESAEKTEQNYQKSIQTMNQQTQDLRNKLSQEHLRVEQQRNRIYQEIQNAQDISRQQRSEQEEIINQLRRQSDQLQKQINSMK